MLWVLLLPAGEPQSIGRQRMTSTSGTRLRYSVATGASIAAAIPIALLQLCASLMIIRVLTDPPFAVLPIAIFGPFVSFAVLAAVIERRISLFDVTTGVLTLRKQYFLMWRGHAEAIPISCISDVEFIDRSGAEGHVGGVQITLNGEGRNEVAAWPPRRKRRSAFDEICEVVIRCKRRAGVPISERLQAWRDRRPW